MWPAVSLDDVFERTKSVTDKADPVGERLVSLVFAPPGAALWRELKYSKAYLNAQTANDWDLFFVGVPSVAGEDAPRGGRDWSRYYQASKFFEVEYEVHRRHANALEAAGVDPRRAWRHTGGSDLVSVLAHHGEPDWLSLNAYRIDRPGGEPLSLAEVAARQRDWRHGDEDPIFWQVHGRPSPVTVGNLEDALTKTAVAVGFGVAGNGAFELIRNLLGR